MEVFRVYLNHMKIEYAICKQRSLLRKLRKMLQRTNSAEFSRCFEPFCGLHNFLPLTGMNCCLPPDILVYTREELYHPPGEQQTFGENSFFHR